MMDLADDKTNRALKWLQEADGLLITAGAGMGVDSGLPDFRGNEGLWRAYPALGTAKRSFESIANPAAFVEDPELAWGFYGHRLQLYRTTQPHRGFGILKRWADRLAHGGFVFTSNVDGQFERAGFPEERIAECHGSIHYMQCSEPCNSWIWTASGFTPRIDEAVCRLTGPFPRCANCGAIARPNILMFWDTAWLSSRANEQEARLDRWLAGVKRPVVIEMGAGTGLPTVRKFSERHGPRVIRINAREPQINPALGIGLQGRAIDVLLALDQSPSM